MFNRRFGKNTEDVEILLSQIETSGYDWIELKYTKTRTKRKSIAKMRGYDTVISTPLRHGNKIVVQEGPDTSEIKSGYVIFYLDEANNNYAYVVDTKRNKQFIKKHMKLGWVYPTDKSIRKEINEMPDQPITLTVNERKASYTEKQIKSDYEKQVAENLKIKKEMEELKAMIKDLGAQPEPPLKKVHIDKSKLGDKKSADK